MSRDRNLLSNITSLLVCGLLAGLVVAAAAFPAIAVSGLAAKAGADNFENLPEELKAEPVPQLTQVFANDGKTLITSFYDESRQPITLDEVPQVMRDAIIAVEDGRFYEHNGVDPRGVIRALVANSGNGEVSEGASTLTMQYVRNVLKYNADSDEEILQATEDTPERKIREMRYAMAIEKELSKDEILIRYLNIAFFGNRAYGIYAASQAYFSKDPEDLTLPEAAMIAGMVKAPGSYDPSTGDNTAATDRRNHVLDRMLAEGYITQAEADEAKASELKLDTKEQPSECVDVPKKHNDWGFFCDYLKQWWMDQEAFGADSVDRLAKLKQGGYTVITSLDPDLQENAVDYIADEIGKNTHWALGSVVVEPGTGRILTMAVNRKYSLDISDNPLSSNSAKAEQGIKGTYPNTTVPLFTVDQDGLGGFQIGSTAKMFTMLAALENGLPLTTKYNSPSPYKSKIYGAGYEPSPASCGSKLPSGEYAWCPENASPDWMNGNRTMWDGFGKSVNTYFVQLIEAVGAEKVVATMEKLGITWHRAADIENAQPGCQEPKNPDVDNEDLCLEPSKWGGLTLGFADTTPLEVANAYATVAAEGKYCAPTPILKITDRDGNEVEAGNPQCEQRISPDVARAATDAARCPVGDQAISPGKNCNSDGGTAPGVHGIVGKDVMGKTGTTDKNQAAWLALANPKAASASFMADPDSRAYSVSNQEVRNMNEAAAKILRDALEGTDEKFTAPSENMIFGKNPRDVPGVSCDTVEEAKDKMSNAGFKPEVVEGGKSECPKGTVYWTSPDGKAAEGATIQLYVSAGKEKDGNGRGNGDDPPGRGDLPDDPGDGPTLPTDPPSDCHRPWGCDRD